MKKAILITQLTCLFLFFSLLSLGQANPHIKKTNVTTKTILTLPFAEGWDLWNFNTNGWTTDGDNWVINNQLGNPGPTAEFTWDPLLENNYASALTSSPIDASLISEGDIFLDFDIQLNDRHSTGLELLQVEVFNDSVWNTVASFSNTESFTWQSHHIKITPYAIQRMFKIRFKAVGDNSFDILSWFVDNIEVYRTCASVSEVYCQEWALEDIIIYWNAPFPQPIAEWMYYDDGYNIDGIGGPDTMMWAIKFDPDQLEELAGASLTKVRIYNRTNATDELRIFEGPDAETLLHTQPLDSLPVEAWATVELTEPILIDVSQEFWIAVYSTDGANYPAACGYAMGEPNGDLVSLDGITWDHLTDYSIMNTWNLRGFVTETTGVVTELKQKKPKTSFGKGLRADLSLSGHGTGQNNVLVENGSANRSIVGFNIYKKEGQNADFEFYDNVPALDSSVICSFIDTDVDWTYEYNCYQVTCVWENGSDYCESAPGFDFQGMNDFICYIWNGVTNDIIKNQTTIFPNPATNEFTITSSEAMTQLSLLSITGQVVFQQKLESEKSTTVDTKEYPSGIYFVKISTSEGIITQKLVLNKQ